MKSVALYTRLGCTTCDDAYQILLELSVEQPLEIDMIDLNHAYNAALNEQYGDQVPLVVARDQEEGLPYPFTIEQLRAYVGVSSS